MEGEKKKKKSESDKLYSVWCVGCIWTSLAPTHRVYYPHMRLIHVFSHVTCNYVACIHTYICTSCAETSRKPAQMRFHQCMARGRECVYHVADLLQR